MSRLTARDLQFAFGAQTVLGGVDLSVGPGDRIGIVAMRDRRVIALIVLKIDNGLVVHIDALAGEGPRSAVSRALRLG